ncbi:MAG: L,D-transpeptidase/peptidoglycan binding protein [Eubacterium sp.]|nr:L,D-transpeptidase/peptidoglycan binding protein [Candidatus Colimonas fimequi]
MKKIIVSFCVLILVLAAAFGGLLFAYTQSDDYTSDKFPANYKINGIDVSGQTYDEARKTLADQWNHQTFHVTDESGNDLVTFTNFGCTYNIAGSLEKVKHDNLLMSALNHYSKAPVDADMKMAVKTCSNEFRKKLMNSDFLNQDSVTETVDAYVDVTDPAFPIVKEVYGTKIDGEKFFDKVVRNISAGTLKMTFNPEEFYEQPKVLSDDETLLAYQKFCQEKLNQKITYDIGDESFTINKEDLASMYATDGSGNPNEEGIEEFVARLAKTYDNVGAERTITTLRDKKVTIKGGTEGWKIDQDAEAEQLAKDLTDGEDVTRKPKYSQEGYGDYTRTVGDTYIDVDFTKQEVYVFIRGKDKFHCKVVTGDKSKGKSTPEGLWYVKNKLRDVTMRGTNADGSKYEVPALYWMGITPNGIGFHDSNWRTEFGGDIWKTNGSHGCINMPKDKIPDMFKIVKVGMPVLMHN